MHIPSESPIIVQNDVTDNPLNQILTLSINTGSGLPDYWGKPCRKTEDFVNHTPKPCSKSQTRSKAVWNHTYMCTPYRRPHSRRTKLRHTIQMNRIQTIQKWRYMYRLVWNRGYPYRFGRWHPCWHEDMLVTYSINSPDPYCGKKYLTFWNCVEVISGTMWSIFQKSSCLCFLTYMGVP